MKRHGFLCSILIATLVMSLSLTGCGNNGENTEKTEESVISYIDDQAVGIIATGFEKRQDVIASQDGDASATSYREAVKAELDNDGMLKNAQFKDSKLHETCIAYINSLDAQMEALDNYTFDSVDFALKWEEAYNNRSKILKTLVNDYGLTVDQKYESSLSELVMNGGAAEKQDAAKEAINSIVSGATWEMTEDYGYYTYTAIIENTTDYNFKDVYLVVNLYDADDIKTESAASTTTWSKGEKVKFEAYGDTVEASRVEAIVQYFTVD